MSRRRTTTDTLEHQAAPDSDRETTPFDGYEMPNHEAKLNDLDARGDALNGHGVRPSEMCGVVAGSGPYPGRRCTFRQHENDQPHSWEPGANKISAELPAGQQTLPGTPEPEQNEYTVPTEASFGKAKLQPAHGLKAIGDRLIADDASLETIGLGALPDRRPCRILRRCLSRPCPGIQVRRTPDRSLDS